LATKTHPFGTTLGYADTVGGVYTTLTDLIDVTPPSVEIGKTETTHLASTGKAREYIAGWRDPGMLEFTGYLTKAQFTTLKGFADAGTQKFWKVTFPLIDSEATATILISFGFISKIGVDQISMEGDDAIKCPFEVCCSGDDTFTAGS
jgi:hypothetical protein